LLSWSDSQLGGRGHGAVALQCSRRDLGASRHDGKGATKHCWCSSAPWYASHVGDGPAALPDSAVHSRRPTFATSLRVHRIVCDGCPWCEIRLVNSMGATLPVCCHVASYDVGCCFSQSIPGRKGSLSLPPSSDSHGSWHWTVSDVPFFQGPRQGHPAARAVTP